MKIIFIGNVNFSFEILKKLISLKANIVGVLTKKESKFNSDHIDLSILCKKNEIDYKYVAKINDSENVNWIKQKKPDIIFCFGFSQIIKKDILDIPPRGVIGFHPASLPKNRGRHPLIWALVLGLKKTSSTFFFMDEGADSGDILSQKKIKISYKDNANSLYMKVVKKSIKQVEKFYYKLLKFKNKRKKQLELKSNYWRKRGKLDGQIDFKMNSKSIYYLVRALTKPYVGAHLVYNGQEVKVWKVKEKKLKLSNIEYGKVLKIKGNEILIKCMKNAIIIKDHEFEKLPKVGDYIL